MQIVTFYSGALVTTSVVVADSTKNAHASVIKLVRTYLSDFSEFGRVGFEIRPFATKGGEQTREVAILNEQQATLLVTYLRNSEVVRKFKKALVKAFYELRDSHRRLRHEAASTTKMRNAVLVETRAAVGKFTGAPQFMSEQKLTNWAHSGAFSGINRDALSIDSLDLLAHVEIKSATLIGLGLTYEERKPILKRYADEWRMLHVGAIDAPKPSAAKAGV